MALEIHPLLLGEAEVDTSFLIWGMTPGQRTTVPLTAYLVLGGEKPLLIDAGMSIEGGRHEEGFFVFTQTHEQTLSNRLAPFGLEPEDIGTVVFTHLHSDHTGYIEALSAARFVVQRRELQYAAAPYFPVSGFRRKEVGELVGLHFDRIDFVEGDMDVAEGVRASWTGGHSPGHQQVEVRLESGVAVACGDNVYLLDPGLTEGLPPGLITSIEEHTRAIARLRTGVDYVLPSHEPSIYERYPDGLR